jgi:hypothetical protein
LVTKQNYHNKSSKNTWFFYETSYWVSHKNKAAFFAKVLFQGKEEAKNKNQWIDHHHPLKSISARGLNKNKG